MVAYVTAERGAADPFIRVAEWDDEASSFWADRLERRAMSDSQCVLRQRLVGLAQLRPGDRVAELGCGTGHLLADLAQVTGPRGSVLGIEPQPGLADRARARTRELPAVVVHTQSADRLPAEDGTLDAVLAQTVLLHLPSRMLDAVLTEARRVLKPGGRFVSADQDSGSRIIDHPDRESTRSILLYDADQLHANGWLGRQLPRLLRTAGFEVTSVEVHAFLATSAQPFLVSSYARIAREAAAGGAITAAAAEQWIAQLTELADSGSFLDGINYYLTAAVRKER
jgi:ubiquinone/menaquinone biosynthesis C-methylase UbiE